jgi:hypothetical protein
MISTTIVAHAQDYFHIYADTLSVSNDAMSTKTMTKRLKQDAEKYAQYAPIPRMAEMDISFAADPDEFKKLNGYGVLYIPSLNRDNSEYPIKKVYIKQGNVITELKKIGEINIGVQDKYLITIFGKNRIDYYYLIPYQLTQVYGELMIDWSNNRKEFLLNKFPNENAVDYDTKKINMKNATIDNASLKIFLKREYNLDTN